MRSQGSWSGAATCKKSQTLCWWRRCSRTSRLRRIACRPTRCPRKNLHELGAETVARGHGRALGGPPLGRAGYAGGWSVDSSRAKRAGTTPTLLKAALAYARRGVPVFPCEPGGKRPLTYNGFWDSSADPRRVAAWWDRWPDANLGVPTGERSGLLVLDIDRGGAAPRASPRWNGRTARSPKRRRPAPAAGVCTSTSGTQQQRRCATARGNSDRDWT